jgi:hypothetical protein
MAKKQQQEKSIRVTCEGAAVLPVEQLIPYQGNLKSLSNSDYERLKKQILDLGFSEPVGVWRNGGKFYILSGHQRCRVVGRMVRDEGYHAPALPVTFIDAADANEAKRKVLALTSQFGKMEKDGLYEFLQGSDIEADELFEGFRFPEVDLAAFTEEFFVDQGSNDEGDIGGAIDAAAESASRLSPAAIPPPAAVADLDAGVQVSHVKMVQLFFKSDAHKAFMDACTELAKDYGTENITDTVAKAVEVAHAATRKPA